MAQDTLFAYISWVFSVYTCSRLVTDCKFSPSFGAIIPRVWLVFQNDNFNTIDFQTMHNTKLLRTPSNSITIVANGNNIDLSASQWGHVLELGYDTNNEHRESAQEVIVFMTRSLICTRRPRMWITWVFAITWRFHLCVYTLLLGYVGRVITVTRCRQTLSRGLLLIQCLGATR